MFFFRRRSAPRLSASEFRRRRRQQRRALRSRINQPSTRSVVNHARRLAPNARTRRVEAAAAVYLLLPLRDRPGLLRCRTNATERVLYRHQSSYGCERASSFLYVFSIAHVVAVLTRVCVCWFFSPLRRVRWPSSPPPPPFESILIQPARGMRRPRWSAPVFAVCILPLRRRRHLLRRRDGAAARLFDTAFNGPKHGTPVASAATRCRPHKLHSAAAAAAATTNCCAR